MLSLLVLHRFRWYTRWRPSKVAETKPADEKGCDVSMLAKAAMAAILSAAAAPLGAGQATALPPAGSCAGGEFRWTAINGLIGMQPQLLTFTSVGVLRDCVGGPPEITSGTFTGTHIAWSDCMHPADGPITVNITWSNGERSTLTGPWPVTMVQPTVGPLEVIDGLGRGYHAEIVAEYEMMTPEMIGGCFGPGLRTGTGRVSGTTFQ
ncbi:hypothetical protein [Nocardia sp. NPDC052566]|uniref:hypothetical protein n=1 Tax=Nocardia sp. NPDC052566 TaxID=3364330 RepID=UPI0037CA0C0C